MTLKKITDRDLQGYGVIGMADTPNLSARQMQEKVEEVVRSVVIPVINRNIDYTASKQDLADAVLKAGAGDMAAIYYDTDGDGIVNKSDNGFFIYTHSGSSLTGRGENGRFKATSAGIYTMFYVNGRYCSVKQGDENEIELAADAWYTFILDGNTINFKQGGAGLNFTVVGGSVQPASPKENTIWVNTDAEITGWVFDAQQPDYLEAGNVWLKTGQYGKMGMNAVKKNCIFIYPQSCQQWDGTAFTARDIQIYKDGAWTGFADVIYAGGTWYYTSRTSLYNGGTVTDGADSVIIRATSANSSSAYVGAYVDLTGYSKLVMTGNKTVGSGNSKCGIFVTDANTANQYAMWNGDSTVCHEISTTAGRQEIMLDISALSGSYYVWIGVYSAAVAGELQVTEFRME